MPKPPAPPAGAKLVTLSTDTDCPDQWRAGRNDFQGWASALATIDNAIKSGMPVVKVGNPVYYEPLAVAVDRSGANDTDFVAAVSKIVTAMHADGTLTAFSMKWYGTDLTKATP